MGAGQALTVWVLVIVLVVTKGFRTPVGPTVLVSVTTGLMVEVLVIVVVRIGRLRHEQALVTSGGGN